jgi:hypothetical protein
VYIVKRALSIGLCGSHRTGKTTLAGTISERTGIPFVRTATSEVFKANALDPSSPLDFKTRLWIQQRILDAAESVWDAGQGQFITDRTPLDMAAYTLADIQGRTEVNFVELEEYLSRCFAATNKFFDLLVLIQPGIPLVHEQGKAALNEGYLEHLNYLILGLCGDERVKSRLLCLPRAMMAVSDRATMILNALDTREAQ